MANHPGEDEQLEALKKWWKENGTMVIVGFVAGVAVLFGGRAWFDHKQTQSEAATAELSLLLNELNVGDNSSIGDKADEIIASHKSSSQADFAALIKARTAVDAGNSDEAKRLLQAIVDKPSIAGLDDLARLRLARILVTESSHDEALALLTNGSDGFQPHYQELRGDIYLAKGQINEAREAYQAALTDPSVLASGQQLRLKLDSLGEGESS